MRAPRSGTGAAVEGEQVAASAKGRQSSSVFSDVSVFSVSDVSVFSDVSVTVFSESSQQATKAINADLAKRAHGSGARIFPPRELTPRYPAVSQNSGPALNDAEALQTALHWAGLGPPRDDERTRRVGANEHPNELAAGLARVAGRVVGPAQRVAAAAPDVGPEDRYDRPEFRDTNYLHYPEPPAVARVGVPGGRQPDWKRPWREVAFRWAGTGVAAALTAVSTYVILAVYGIFIGLAYAQIASYDNSSHDRHDHDRYVELQDFHSQQSFDPSIVALATFLCTFNIGQYFSFVVVRWEARFDNLWQSNSLIKAVQLEALTWCRKGNEAYRPTVEIPRLLRLLHLMNHVVHMELGRYNKLGEREWAVLEGRGLITKEERQILEQMRHKDQTVAAWCFEQASSFSLHGACDEHTAKSVLAGNIQQAYKYGTKQNAYELMNVPYPYFQMMTLNICILLVLLMWNSAVRFTSALELAQHFESTIVATVPATEAAFEILGIVLVVLELQVVWHVALILTSPYDEDPADVDLDFELQRMWAEALEPIAQLCARPKRSVAWPRCRGAVLTTLTQREMA